MNTLIKSAEFDKWLSRLKDSKAKARIIARLISAAHGNFGDYKLIQAGIHEMRIDAGPGYRVYYLRQGSTIYFLLLGGDKSTQEKDIKRALEMAKAIKE